MNVPLNRKTVRMERHIGGDTHQIVVEGSFALPANLPDIARVVRLEAHPVVTDRNTLEDEVVVHGAVDFVIVYAHDEETVRPARTQPGRSPRSEGEEPASERPDEGDGTEIEAEHGFAPEEGPRREARHDDHHHDHDDDPWHDDDFGGVERREMLYRHRWRRGASFETVFDMPGVQEGVQAFLRAESLDIEVHLHSNGRGIDVEAVVGIGLKVSDDDIRDVAVKGANFPTAVEATERPVSVENVFARGQTSISVEGTLPLSAETPAKTVADIRATVHLEETGMEWNESGEGGRLHGKGSIAYRAVVMDEQGETDSYSWQHETPFAFSVDIHDGKANQGGRSAPVEAEAFVRGLDAAPTGDGRGIEVFVDIDVGARVAAVEPLVLVVELDGGDGWDIRYRTDTFRLEQWIGRQEREMTVTGQLDLPQGYPPIERMLGGDATIRVEDVLVLGDKVIVEGRFDVSGMYVARTEGRPVHYVHWDGPLVLEGEVEVNGAEPGMEADVNVDIIGVEMDLFNRETVEATVRFRTRAKVTHPTERDAVVEAVAVPPPEADPPTLTFVVVQADDTLWKLSHRYHTDIGEIVGANPWLESADDELTPGRKLCVPRRKPAAPTTA